jgi:hypothetical protein
MEWYCLEKVFDFMVEILLPMSSYNKSVNWTSQYTYFSILLLCYDDHFYVWIFYATCQVDELEQV